LGFGTQESPRPYIIDRSIPAKYLSRVSASFCFWRKGFGVVSRRNGPLSSSCAPAHPAGLLLSASGTHGIPSIPRALRGPF